MREIEPENVSTRMGICDENDSGYAEMFGVPDFGDPAVSFVMSANRRSSKQQTP
jgi:hypothetical protein